MKKLFLMTALALVCALALAACAPAATPEPDPDEPIGIPDPFVEVASYEELTAACPGIAIRMVPEGSTHVSYRYCKDLDGKVMFAQEDFSFDGDTYQYRVMPCATEAEADDMLHGYYYDFTADEIVSEKGSIPYRLRTYDAEGIAVATWYSGVEQCQYSLTTHTSQEPDIVIKKVISNFVMTDFG